MENKTINNQSKKPNLARRERLNPDWPIAIYNFDAFPINGVPQAVWDSERQKNKLWDDLCALFDRASKLDEKKEVEILKKVKGKREMQLVKVMQSALSKDERRAVWLPFGQRKTVRPEPLPESEDEKKRIAREKAIEIYDLSAKIYGGEVPSLHLYGKQYKGVIPSAYYESVISRFLVTVKEWQKAPSVKGVPKPKRGIERINLPIVFNEGTTLDELAQGRNVSLRYTEHLKRERGESYLGNAHFNVGCDGARFDLHVAHTRPLEAQAFRANHAKKAIPANHRVKRVSLVGRNLKYFGWKWSYQVQIEHEPSRTPRQMTGVSCGLDLGYRVREDGLRVACLTDTTGRVIEFVLPFSAEQSRDVRKRAKKWTDYEIADWRLMPERLARLDAMKDQCKARVKELQNDSWPEEAKLLMGGFHKLGIKGLRRLATYLPDGNEAKVAIAEWWAEYEPLARRYAGHQQQLNAIWEDARKQFAAWLAQSYDQIAWEADLNLKELAEQWTSVYDGALHEAQKWRQRASLHSQRQWITLQAGKHKAELVDGGTAYSTQTCKECGGAIEPGGKLLLVCENGHKNDQDANASGLFCSKLQVTAGMSANLPNIPASLSRYLRVVSASN